MCIERLYVPTVSADCIEASCRVFWGYVFIEDSSKFLYILPGLYWRVADQWLYIALEDTIVLKEHCWLDLSNPVSWLRWLLDGFVLRYAFNPLLYWLRRPQRSSARCYGCISFGHYSAQNDDDFRNFCTSTICKPFEKPHLLNWRSKLQKHYKSSWHCGKEIVAKEGAKALFCKHCIIQMSQITPKKPRAP